MLMKQRRMKRLARLLTMLLAVVVTACFVPQMNAPSCAEEGVPATAVTSQGVLGHSVNTENAYTVWFGSIPWRVIGYDHQGVALADDAATLLAAGNLSDTYFNENYSEYGNSYAHSYLREAMDGTADSLSAPEQAAIRPRTLESGEWSSNYHGAGPDGTAGETVGNALMWPLSAAEAYYTDSTLRKADPDYSDTSRTAWWLRSPGYDGGGNTGPRIMYVASAGSIPEWGATIQGNDTYRSILGVRPAFQLDMNAVLLTSALHGGKNSGIAGPNALKKITETDSNEWKLTLHDSSRDGEGGFTASLAEDAMVEIPEGYESWTIPVIYSGAGSGSREYVSAILCDYDGNVLYYGNIAKNKPSSPEEGQEINLPTGLPSGYYELRIFSELLNNTGGSTECDFASQFHSFELAVYDIPVTGVSLDKNEMTLAPGETETLKASVTPANATDKSMIWSSDNEEVATVDQTGKVTAIEYGTAQITATANNGKKATCELTVEDPKTYYTVFFSDGLGNVLKSERVEEGTAAAAPEDPLREGYSFEGWDAAFDNITKDTLITAQWKRNNISTEGVTLDKGSVTMKVGETETLTATVLPEDATDKSVTWSSDDESVVTVDQTGKITANSAGNAIVTVTTTNGNKKAFCEVNVQKQTVYYSVFFTDGQGNLLKTENVPEETAATAPEDPSRDGYVFGGWNKSFNHITEDTLVTAKWKTIITDAEVTLSETEFTYDGDVQRPRIEKIDGMTLAAGIDYRADWSDRSSTDAGTYSVTIIAEEDGDYFGQTEATYRINPARVAVPKGKTLTYNGQAQTGVALGTKYRVNSNIGTNAGTYEASVSLIDIRNYCWEDGGTDDKQVIWIINKAANPLAIKAKTATVKYSQLKKKNQTLAVTKVIIFTKKASDKKTYALSAAKKGSKSFKKYFMINKTTGKVTVKKGLQKGTYKVTVQAKAAGNSNYKASGKKTVTFTVKVK